MAESGNIKDETIHILVQMVRDKDEELKYLRNENKDLKEKLYEEDRRKLSMRDAGTQILTVELKDIDSEPVSLESMFSHTDQTSVNKQYEGNNLDTGNIDAKNYRSDESVETNNSSFTTARNNNMKNAIDSIDVDEKRVSKLTKTSRRGASCRLSFKRRANDHVTQKCVMRYQMSRRSIKRKKRSPKFEQSQYHGEVNLHTVEASENKSSCIGKTTLTDLLPEWQRHGYNNTTMHLLKPDSEYNVIDGDLGCSFSGSNNCLEMNCHEMNRKIQPTNTLKTSNLKVNLVENDDTDCSYSTYNLRSLHDLESVVPERELTFTVPPDGNLSNRHNIIYLTRSEKECSAGNVSTFLQHEGRAVDDLELEETSAQPLTVGKTKRHVYNDTDSSLNESYV